MEKTELSLFVECHEFVCSIDTKSIERLVLPSEISPLAGEGNIARVQVGNRIYATFNFGRLLGLPPTHGASILVRTVFGGVELPLAFETGPCLVVRSSEESVKLPSGLFNARRRALVGAFGLPAGMARIGRAPVGLRIELDELLTAAERDSAAAALRSTPQPAASAP